jgi:hypothetical protein
VAVCGAHVARCLVQLQRKSQNQTEISPPSAGMASAGIAISSSKRSYPNTVRRYCGTPSFHNHQVSRAKLSCTESQRSSSPHDFYWNLSVIATNLGPPHTNGTIRPNNHIRQYSFLTSTYSGGRHECCCCRRGFKRTRAHWSM